MFWMPFVFLAFMILAYSLHRRAPKNRSEENYSLITVNREWKLQKWSKTFNDSILIWKGYYSINYSHRNQKSNAVSRTTSHQEQTFPHHISPRYHLFRYRTCSLLLYGRQYQFLYPLECLHRIKFRLLRFLCKRWLQILLRRMGKWLWILWPIQQQL